MDPVELTRRIAAIEWKELPHPVPSEDGLPYATHEGILQIGSVPLLCYRLSDGRRVLPVEDVNRLFEELFHQ